MLLSAELISAACISNDEYFFQLACQTRNIIYNLIRTKRNGKETFHFFHFLTCYKAAIKFMKQNV